MTPYYVDNMGDSVFESIKSDIHLQVVNAYGLPFDSGVFDVSADGKKVLFTSGDSSLVANDTNNNSDVFVKDIPSGSIQRVNTDSLGNQTSNTPMYTGGDYYASFSSDARYVIFSSRAPNLVASDTNDRPDIFIKDLQTGNTQIVSTDSTGNQVYSGFGSATPALSFDGRFAVFQSSGMALVGVNEFDVKQIFVKNLLTGEIKIASSDANGQVGDGLFQDNSGPSISADGRYVMFESSSNNLVSGDVNNASDVFLKDMVTGEIKKFQALMVCLLDLSYRIVLCNWTLSVFRWSLCCV